MCKTFVRPTLLCGAATRPLKRVAERKLNVAEMRVLRGTCWVTRADRMRNERVRDTAEVVEASARVQERRLQWFSHMMRRKTTWEEE